MDKEVKNNKLKRKYVFVVLVLLIIIIIFGLTISYFRSDFTSRNSIVGTGEAITIQDSFNAPNKWRPGESVDTDFKVSNPSRNSTTLAVRAKIKEYWNDATDKNKLDNGEDVVLKELGSNWELNGEYYYYTEELNPNEETTSLFTKLTFNKNAEAGLICTTVDEVRECSSDGTYAKSKYKLIIEYELIEISAIEEWEYNPFFTPNSNIVNAWTYNESSCQENDGESCTPTECYKDSAAGSCAPGTIIDYKVNSSTTVRFHVIKDDGKTMRLQQQKNITSLNGTKWYATSNDNTDGPSTILPALENATSSWTNVETQNYTLGTTTFDGVTSVGCTWTDGSAPNSSNCTSATYTKLGGSASGLTRSAKARLITAQEAGTLGCKMGTNGSCPKWMINYLNDGHTNSGAKFYDTANTAGNYGYWTSSALAANAAGALGVYYYGYVSHPYTTGTNFGARAVVVINK